MQSIEKFMQQYFDERIAEEKREQASRAPFRRKFYTEDCRWESRVLTLEMLLSERILKATDSGAMAEVITSRELSSVKENLKEHRLRYRLQQCSDGWLIESVDVWCSFCLGESGQTSCMLCQGSGWLDGKRRRRKGDVSSDD